MTGPTPGAAPVAAAARRLLLVVVALGATACAGERTDQRPIGAPAAAGAPVAAGARAGPGRPLTTEEQAGEAIYRRENCARCHTLFDLPAPEGPLVLPVPRLPSALDPRVGPDLGLEGHRRSDDWQHAHLYAPEVVVPGSRMTAYRHLFRPGPGGRPVPTIEGRSLVAWLQTLGRERRDAWAESRRREPEIPAPDGRPDGERLALGERLYALHCVACHGVAGDGRGPAAALLTRAPRDFTSGAYRFRSTPAGERPRDADLFRSITLGAGAGAAMPGFAHLEAEERWALVRRIREFAPALAGRPVSLDTPGGGSPGAAGAAGAEAGADGTAPGADGMAAGADGTTPGAGDDAVAAGAALYAELGCAACHGADAEGRPAPGDGSTWRDEAGLPIPATGDLRHPCGLRGGASEEAFRRALLHGVGPVMPSFAQAIDGRPWAPRAIRAWLLARDVDRGATAATPAGP